MKHLLYIDLLCPVGHLSFNGIWLRALTACQDFKVTVAMPAHYEKALDYDRKRCDFIELPENWFLKVPSSGGRWRRILLRMKWITCMWRIFKSFDARHYDLIVVSSFDTPTAFFGPRWPNLLWVGHTLAEQIRKHWILKLFLQSIGRYSHVAVLGHVPFEKLREAGIHNIVEFPHGCPKPFPPVEPALMDFSCDIFSPGKSHLDSTFGKMIAAQCVQNALVEANLKIVLRQEIQPSDSVQIVRGRIPFNEYVSRMQASAAILICYEDAYLRCSAVLLEAMVSNRPIFMRRIPVFSHLDAIPGISMFSNEEELAQCIRKLALGQISPNYTSVLETELPELIPQKMNGLMCFAEAQQSTGTTGTK
jgi:hypothetical protein